MVESKGEKTIGYVHCHRSGSDADVSGEEARIHFDVACLTRQAIVPGQQRTLTAGVEDVGVRGRRCDVPALAAADRIERGERIGADGQPSGPPAAALTLHADSAVVLLRAAYVV